VTGRPPARLFAVLAVCLAGAIAALVALLAGARLTDVWWGPPCAVGVLLSSLGIVGHYSVARERRQQC
jgi:hypothetical protein